MTISILLQNFLTLDVAIGLAVGVLGGMTIGALPGLSASMGVALLIPVSYGMNPVAALVMLTSLYTAAIYGGSFTAILIHTPGTPSSAATARDGYEFTKQGRGLEAVGWATIASVIGGTISGIALLLIAPPLARVALRFSSPEYFFLALFGLTIIGTLTADSPLKGLASGAIGLVVALIGMDHTTGFARLTFGNFRLINGVELIPALLGLFSISQMMLQAEQMATKHGLSKGQVMDDSTVIGGRFFPRLGEFIKQLPNIIRSGIIGVVVGIMPGAGGDIACWVSYNEAKRASKNPEEFGKGSVSGLVASEAANNGVTGGALVPMLTLGVPGSGVAAILLGGLLVHGLSPGPSLFTRDAAIVYPIMVGFLSANILMGIVGCLAAKHVVKISIIPMNILTPFVIILSLIGAYAMNFSIFNVYIMMVFGLIGYFMRKNGFPTAPVVLALILGPMADKGLSASILMTRGQPLVLYFLSRPLSVLFMVMTVISIFAPLLMSRIRKASETAKGVGASAVTAEED